MQTSFRYLFGPVPSRRLGMSLGVDLVPHKTCTLDCLYCEVGRTTHRTTQLKEYIPADGIIQELDACLEKSPGLDAITFSGFGEPLLNSEIERIIDYLKERHPSYKIALLTNSTLLPREGIREKLKRVDLVLPSLDAASQEVWERMSRPCPGIRVEEIVEALRALRRESEAQMWMEVFILPGYNDDPRQIGLLRQALLYIEPDLVQLNTLDRPGSQADLEPASIQSLQRIAEDLAPLPCELVAGLTCDDSAGEVSQGDITGRILETVKRRPCTSRDLASTLGMSLGEVQKHLTSLRLQGLVTPLQGTRGIYWKGE